MPRILVVEDTRKTCDALSRRLQLRLFEIIIAVDGQPGVAAAKAQKPDLVLMDMNMPEVDGWEATRQIKADPSTAEVPVIALTGHAMSSDRERAMEAGCTDYHTKPIEFSKLLAQIDSILQARGVSSSPTHDAGRRSHEMVGATLAQMASILAVDDDLSNRESLHRRLMCRDMPSRMQPMDFKPSCIALDAGKFDLVILDVMMPGMSGLQVLEKVRQSHSPNQLPIIMATAKDDGADIVHALERGASDYVTKPLDFSRCWAALKPSCCSSNRSIRLWNWNSRSRREMSPLNPPTPDCA